MKLYPKSKLEAIGLGEKRYFTGIPCRRGHISYRLISGHCFECSRITSRRAGERASIEDRRRWYKAYINKNPEKTREIRKSCGDRYRKNNRKAHYESTKKWRTKNPEKLKAQYTKRYTRKKNCQNHFTYERVLELMILQNGKCVYCKKDISNKYHIDHIMPLCLGGENSPENIQLLCPFCNISKGGKHPDVFAKERGVV